VAHETEHGGDLEALETRRVDTHGSIRDREELFASHRPGETLGRYVLLRPLGAGGMSVVWHAFDPELDRRVALKLMHETRKGAAAGAQRLLREAQALARLSHANVVHVYDVGIVGGEVYLAMELVDGNTLREWLSESPRQVEDILATLTRAGAGLAAAHDAGLVHLDFKPTNVVVGKDGGVRVVDFGLARAPAATAVRSSDEFSAQRSGVRRLGERLTEDGAVLGTPGYIPPEILSGQTADGRADQFSFCVTAWEALFGERPFEGDEARIHEPKASPTVLARVPRSIRVALTRGLAFDPADRFASMRELLAAIRAPPSKRTYAIVGLGIVGIAGLVGLQGPWAAQRQDPCDAAARGLADVWSAPRAHELQQSFVATGAPFAADTWATAAKVIDIHAEQWSRQARDACEARTVRADQSAQTYELRRACLHESREKLEALVRLFAAPDASLVEHAVTAAVSIGDPADCADVEALRIEASMPADPALRARVEALRRDALQAQVMNDAGRVKQSWAALAPLLAGARTIGHPPTLALVLRIAAGTRASLGDPHRAAELLEEGLVVAEAAGLDEMRFLIYSDIAYVVGHQLRDRRRGVYAADAATALHERIDGNESQSLRLLVTRGILASGIGEYDRALEYYEQALAVAPPADPVLATLLLDLGGVHYEHGKFELALDYYQRAYELQLAQLGPNHPSTALVLENRGNAQQALGNFDAALADQERSLAVHEATGVNTGISFALQLNNVGVVLSGMQRYTDAVKYYERARVALGENNGSHPLAAVLLTNLGEARLAQGLPDEALGLYRTAVGKLEATMGDRHQYVGVALTGVGLAELELGDHAAAREHLARAMTIHAGGGDPVQRAETELGLARAIMLAGTPDERALAKDYAMRARGAFVDAGARGASGRERVDALLQHFNRP
jgi:tetratricopeptide (TPR) repeat protein